MKTCPGCSTARDEALFRGVKCDRVYSSCVLCRRRRGDTDKSRRSRLAHNQINREAVKRFLFAYLLEHPCVDCGEKDPVVLEFDHVRGEKKFKLSKGGRLPMYRVEAELQKTEVRCANCHRKVTEARAPGWKTKLKQESLYKF